MDRRWIIAVVGVAVLAAGGRAADRPEAGFAAKPAVSKDGDKTKITFAVKAPTDVEVAVVDADGKIVRHLAAGVLGATNAPAPLKANSLEQSLEWDGKADWGMPVPATAKTPFKVRVRAGMKVKFGRLIGDSPYNFSQTVCRGLAVDPKNGDLYVMFKKTSDASLYFLRVYDRTGKYLREIMPYPAGLDAKSREPFGTVPVPGLESPAPMNYFSLWPYFYPINPSGGGGAELAYKLMAVHPTEDAVYLLPEGFYSFYRIRKSDGGAVNNPFAEPLWEQGKKLAGSGAVGPMMGAVAPDGKTLYFAGYAGMPKKGEKTPNAAWPDGRVYRAQVVDGQYKTDKFVDVTLPEGTKPPQNSWNVLGNIQSLHGVTVDKSGRVYVCDAAGGKVWAFTPDGQPAGSAAVSNAYIVAVNDKNGSLYVLTRKNAAYGVWPKSLVKLSGIGPDAQVQSTLVFPDRGSALDPFLAADFTAAEPQLWVGGCPRDDSVARIVEKDGKLEIAEDLADRGKLEPGFACRLDVDPEADLVYVHNGWANILRYNGLTGEYAGQLGKDGRPQPIIGSEFCIRRDGMIYLSGYEGAGGGYSGPWTRLNRDLTPAPLPDGKKQFVDRYGKMGGGYFGNQGSCVTPDGHLYFNGMFIFRINAIFEVNPDGTPGRSPRLRDVFANSKTTEKKSEKISPTMVDKGYDGALVGWLQDQSGGVEVDQ